MHGCSCESMTISIQILSPPGNNELQINVKSSSENLSHINLEYARLVEGNEDVLEWIPIESQWEDDRILISPLIDGYTYYFRANPVDLSGNENSRNPYLSLEALSTHL